LKVIPFIVAAIANLHEGLFIASTVMVGVFLFILGVSKSMFSYAKWYKSGLETLFVGACSAVSAYLVGLAFEPLTGGA
jgi:VIT1/CCC1 family predicted Fe2+/Mn2+ transporter